MGMTLRDRRRRQWVRTVLVTVAALSAMCLATPVHAAWDTLDAWEPARVLPGEWEPRQAGTPAPYEQGTFTCPGRARTWVAPSDGTTIRLLWWTCDSSDIPYVAARIYQIGRSRLLADLSG